MLPRCCAVSRVAKVCAPQSVRNVLRPLLQPTTGWAGLDLLVGRLSCSLSLVMDKVVQKTCVQVFEQTLEETRCVGYTDVETQMLESVCMLAYKQLGLASAHDEARTLTPAQRSGLGWNSSSWPEQAKPGPSALCGDRKGKGRHPRK